MIKKHILSKGHADNIIRDLKNQEENAKVILKDTAAGKRVFRIVYTGMKRGSSYSHIVGDLANLHFFKVDIGNINHSKGTIKKIKDSIARSLRKYMRKDLKDELDCTKKARPISELFDKMTHNRRTGQMQLAIAPLLNNYELLSVAYVDNYLIDPGANKYSNMMEMVREAGDTYYDPEQVENGSADGAYAKIESTRSLYQASLGIPPESDWILLQHDYAHIINLADEVARTKVPIIETHFKVGQTMTKKFRWGKNYHEAFLDSEDIEQRCVSIADFLVDQDEEDEDGDEDEELMGLIGLAKYSPVLMSKLKFAAHGSKFLFNYIRNLAHYILGLNERLNDSTTPSKKKEEYRGILAKIDILHVAMVYHMYDVYAALAKAQHGVSKVNQLPWHYNERLDHLKSDLKEVMKKDYEGPLKLAKAKLKVGEFETGTLIVTEERRKTRVTVGENSISEDIEKARENVSKFTTALISDIDERINVDSKVGLMRKTFAEFDPVALSELWKIAQSSGRSYGSLDELQTQLNTLKHRFIETRARDEMTKWLMICTKPNLYKGIPDILHLALCCFTKAPLEAPAETIGSLINQHGTKQRCSLTPSSLSNEVQVSWNGPCEHDHITERLIEDSLKEYFEEHTKSGNPRFYVTSKLRFSSSTVSAYMNRKSRIKFD